MNERVLHVDADADRGIDARKRLDGEDGVEEGRAAAAERLGDFDAHHAELEQAIDQRARDLRLLVHLADKGPYFAVRELVHAVVKQALVLREDGQRRSCGFGGLHEPHCRPRDRLLRLR